MCPVAGTMFQMTNVHFLLTTCAVDGVYEKLLEQKLRQDNHLDFVFKSYYSMSQRHINTSRFSVSSQSIDRIFSVFRSSNYSTQGNAVNVFTGNNSNGVPTVAKRITKFLNFTVAGIKNYQYVFSTMSIIPQ